MFCSKCGKEMPDDAVICTGCGCLLKKDIAPQAATSSGLNSSAPQAAQGNAEAKAKRIAKIFFFVSVSIICFAIYLFARGLSKNDVNVNIYQNRIYANLYFRDGYFLASWIFSWFGLGGAITGYVMSRKSKSEALELTSFLLLGKAIVLWIVSLMFCSVYVF